MYLRYAERRGWSTEVLDAVDAELGGYKDVAVAIKSAHATRGIWSRLKFEGGVHRVQRVPVTESQGRIHTSAAGVLVLPEAEEVDVTVDPNDLRIDVFRSSGPGRAEREHHRLRRPDHPPAQRHRGQLAEREEPAAEPGVRAARAARRGCWPPPARRPPPTASDQRRSQVRTIDRSERVRTYNFPENRIADHRVGYKAYNLDQVHRRRPRRGHRRADRRAHTAELLAAGS